MKTGSKICVAVAAGIACRLAPCAAALSPAAPINHNMVLQRDRPVAVWGKANPGATVSVRFGGLVAEATAGADGAWRVSLPPMSAEGKGRTLEIDAGASGRVAFTNVVVGEVWLCSGQSNMSMPLWDKPYIGKNGNRETNGYLDAALVDEPEVRGMMVPRQWSPEPKDIPRLEWKPFAPGRQRAFSALAFHYALTLHRALKVPVGVIQSAWGGTRIEPWISADGFADEPQVAHLAEKPVNTVAPVPDNDSKKPRRDTRHQQPRAIYNAMIHPLAPYTVRGALWYQGESNCADAGIYAGFLRALHSGWSKAFECPDMPFYLVQIAPYGGYVQAGADDTRFCEIWEAEAEFARTQKNCGMAVIVDVGEIDNIHPGDKRTVAMRLAALALNRTYGRKDVPCDSPVLKSWKIEGDTFHLEFAGCTAWVMHGGEQPPFEIAAADGNFVPAQAKFGKDGAVAVRADGVAEPKELRYMWSWRRLGRLKNEVGLPLGPFRIGRDAGR